MPKLYSEASVSTSSLSRRRRPPPGTRSPGTPTPTGRTGGSTARRPRRPNIGGSCERSPIASHSRAQPEKLVVIASSRISVAVRPTVRRSGDRQRVRQMRADRDGSGRASARPARWWSARSSSCAGAPGSGVDRIGRRGGGRDRRVDQDHGEHGRADRCRGCPSPGSSPCRPALATFSRPVKPIIAIGMRERQRAPGRLDAQVDVGGEGRASRTGAPGRTPPCPPGRPGRAARRRRPRRTRRARRTSRTTVIRHARWRRASAVAWCAETDPWRPNAPAT